jgi:hypothetical protein
MSVAIRKPKQTQLAHAAGLLLPVVLLTMCAPRASVSQST